MSENKTRPTDASVDAFLDAVDDGGQRSDARVLADLDVLRELLVRSV